MTPQAASEAHSTGGRYGPCAVFLFMRFTRFIFGSSTRIGGGHSTNLVFVDGRGPKATRNPQPTTRYRWEGAKSAKPISIDNNACSIIGQEAIKERETSKGAYREKSNIPIEPKVCSLFVLCSSNRELLWRL